MATKRPPNPNTAYGRKRMREEFAQRYASMSPEEKAQYDSDKGWATFIGVIILIVIGFIVYQVGGQKALLHWLK